MTRNNYYSAVTAPSRGNLPGCAINLSGSNFPPLAAGYLNMSAVFKHRETTLSGIATARGLFFLDAIFGLTLVDSQLSLSFIRLRTASYFSTVRMKSL